MIAFIRPNLLLEPEYDSISSFIQTFSLPVEVWFDYNIHKAKHLDNVMQNLICGGLILKENIS